ncbi:hypothetical protein UFOVP387_39 [uncultured Caudovirales phage]|jgi:hypothetical protein|uniref:Uncharacterized protein n=1 Tax=uncultured Caudovirales phage TaxID=2100421 RepID=A0A6J7X9Y5_9CAUD|nr:hypothetical protein UFOVP387_39 [uncultured Caudovirales phage]
MSALINVSLRVDKLPKEKFVQGKDGAVYYNFTVAVNDESNQWGQNVSLTDSQTKEEREAKKPKSYLGNGNVIWTNGTIQLAEKKEGVATKEVVGDDLPF